MEATPYLQMQNVYAGYESGKNILKDVNLEVYPNDFIGIIGPNGGGKTTLLKVIMGLIKPVSGELKFNWKDQRLNNIGYLPQVNQIDNSFPIKVVDVVLSGMMTHKRYLKQYTRKDIEKAIELIEKAELGKYSNRSLGELSGGQRQRVFLCRAIINNPKVLILDEPNTYVDKYFEGELYELLKELNKSMSILLVSHDIGTISSMVKTIACVNEHLHYHKTNKISDEILKTYNCPIELVTHGQIPHRVLHNH